MSEFDNLEQAGVWPEAIYHIGPMLTGCAIAEPLWDALDDDYDRIGEATGQTFTEDREEVFELLWETLRHLFLVKVATEVPRFHGPDGRGWSCSRGHTVSAYLTGETLEDVYAKAVQWAGQYRRDELQRQFPKDSPND